MCSGGRAGHPDMTENAVRSDQSSKRRCDKLKCVDVSALIGERDKCFLFELARRLVLSHHVRATIKAKMDESEPMDQSCCEMLVSAGLHVLCSVCALFVSSKLLVCDKTMYIF